MPVIRIRPMSMGMGESMMGVFMSVRLSIHNGVTVPMMDFLMVM